MPRPKNVPIYNEGPSAAAAFQSAMRRIIAPVLPKTTTTDHVTVTETVTIETAPTKKKIRRSRERKAKVR